MDSPDRHREQVAERTRKQRAHATDLKQRTRVKHRLKQIAAQGKLLVSRERIRRQVVESKRRSREAQDRSKRAADSSRKAAAKARQRASDARRRAVEAAKR
jgi:hypothetical protein